MVVAGLFPSCPILPRPQCNNHSNIYFSHRHLVPIRYRKRTIKAYIQRAQIMVPSNDNGGTFEVALRVFVLSDLPTDYSENMSWVNSLSTKRYRKDVLLVAGDVAETYNNFFLTMSVLKDRFKRVFFVPGNHDLWRRSKVEKHCFDREKDITDVRILSPEMVITFYSSFHARTSMHANGRMNFQAKDLSLALYFDALNEKNQHKIDEIQTSCNQIITFSHFLPRQELCPEKRMLFYPNLHKITGSDSLEVRIRSIHGTDGSPSACHVFSHTHFCWDAVLQGIRYVQAPLTYPRERKRRMNGGEDWLPFYIYSSSKGDPAIGSLSKKMSPCYWSDYYSIYTRQPDNTELAPWVAKFYPKKS